jgi:hypothetical protein
MSNTETVAWPSWLTITHISCRHCAQIVLTRDEFSKQSRAASHLTACGEVGVSAPGGVGELRWTGPCKLSTEKIVLHSTSRASPFFRLQPKGPNLPERESDSRCELV